MAHRNKSGGGSEAPEIPITPMLDMSFQLLLFLIPFFKPVPIEGQMDLNLPGGGEAKPQVPEQVDPKAESDMEVKQPSEVTVVVSTAREGPSVGLISRIVVQNKDKEVAIPEDAKWEKALLGELKRMRDSKDLGNKDDITIRADKKLKYDFVVRVMDICSQAGFKGHGFAPPPGDENENK